MSARRPTSRWNSSFLPTLDCAGMSEHDMYSVWSGMLQRCYNPNSDAYPVYGARGITVHLPWHSAKVFIEEFGPRPDKKLQMDRIDNNGNYEPGNVRWTTRRENMNNRRATFRIEYKGEIRPISEVAEEVGLPKSTLYERIKRGDPNPFRAMRIKARTEP